MHYFPSEMTKFHQFEARKFCGKFQFFQVIKLGGCNFGRNIFIFRLSDAQQSHEKNKANLKFFKIIKS